MTTTDVASPQPSTPPHRTVALAHDVLASRAGGERVLCALATHFPDATIDTLVYEPAATFPELADRAIRPSWLNRSTLMRTRYRATLPAAALTWAARTIDADVTICSTSGLSHHVRTSGRRVLYCHTPARWIYEPDVYMAGFGLGIRVVANLLRSPLRWFDKRAMRSADLVLANSHQIAAEIKSIYGIRATVVPPCSTLDIHGDQRPIPGMEPGFVLSPMRPLGYKRFDVLVDAARRRPDTTFLHIGEGPHRDALLLDAPANLHSAGAVDDAELRWAYANARAVAVTCAEDFGLVPLEAAAFGLTTVAPDARGIRDHDPSHLELYNFGSSQDMVRALDRAAAPTGSLDAQWLGVARFGSAIDAALMAVVAEPANSGTRRR